MCQNWVPNYWMVRTSTGLESVVPQVFNFESYPIGYIIWIYYQRVIHIINGIIPLNGDLLTSLINRLPGRMILQVVNINSIPSQWPFQEPIHWRYLPIYIYGPFFRPKFQEISPQFIWPEKWYSVSTSICWILEISHWYYNGLTATSQGRIFRFYW